MKKTIYKEENYKTGKWSGGTTRELAIYPDNAEYLDRDFVWRLSSADSDLDESSFTKLPDYDRILMVLEGEVMLAHGEERTVNLKALEQDSFDGAVKTKCFGKLKKDYNLIMRKGCKGRMEVMDVVSDAAEVTLSERMKESDVSGGECASIGIYCIEGNTVVSVNGETSMVAADRQMVIDCEPGERPSVKVMGQGRCIITEVIFEKQNVTFTEIPGQPASAGDFGAALKLSLTNNRWNKIIRREKKSGAWYDPALEKKLAILDKYMITFAVWVLGVIICLCTLLAGLSSGTVLILVLAFTVVHVLLISPLIYMIVLPKPIAAHIRKPENLNAYEQKLYEEQLARDPHNEKLMHKYRDRSNEEFNGIKDFISKLNK